MKILTNKEVYVQKVDLEFLKYTIHSLPQSISSKIFENSELDVDDFHKYDFFKFENEEDTEFFKSIDYILDYDSFRNFTSEEIIQIGRTYVEKRDQILKRLYAMTKDDKDYNATLLQYKLINYQMESLTDFSDFQSGLLKMSLPVEKKKFQKLMGKIFSKNEKKKN